MNHTFLVLIPKEDSLAKLNDYRLILCLGVSYKVISKLLANRISKVLTNIIVTTQTIFIKDGDQFRPVLTWLKNLPNASIVRAKVLKPANR